MNIILLKDYNLPWENSFLFVGLIQIFSGIPILLFSGGEIEKRSTSIVTPINR